MNNFMVGVSTTRGTVLRVTALGGGKPVDWRYSAHLAPSSIAGRLFREVKSQVSQVSQELTVIEGDLEVLILCWPPPDWWDSGLGHHAWLSVLFEQTIVSPPPVPPLRVSWIPGYGPTSYRANSDVGSSAEVVAVQCTREIFTECLP